MKYTEAIIVIISTIVKKYKNTYFILELKKLSRHFLSGRGIQSSLVFFFINIYLLQCVTLKLILELNGHGIIQLICIYIFCFLYAFSYFLLSIKIALYCCSYTWKYILVYSGEVIWYIIVIRISCILIL